MSQTQHQSCLTLTHWALVQISKLALFVPAVSVHPQLFLAQQPSKLALFAPALFIPPCRHFIFQSQHIVLMGNQKQLRTVIESWEVQALGLRMSIFERLTRESVADIVVSYGWCWYTSAVPFVMLDPVISHFHCTSFTIKLCRMGPLTCLVVPSPDFRLLTPIMSDLTWNWVKSLDCFSEPCQWQVHEGLEPV